jgi:hypothetical protein
VVPVAEAPVALVPVTLPVAVTEVDDEVLEVLDEVVLFDVVLVPVEPPEACVQAAEE